MVGQACRLHADVRQTLNSGHFQATPTLIESVTDQVMKQQPTLPTRKTGKIQSPRLLYSSVSPN
jgi:hypothetical protein